MATSTVTVHPERLQRVVREIARDRGLGAFMSTEAANGMEPYVPFRDGDLMKSANTSRPFYVTYSTPYANRVYWGKGMTIYQGPDRHLHATSEWDKEWWKHHREDFCRAVERYIERML